MDARKNFAYSTVAIPPSPAVSGTTLSVGAGTGVRFPDPAVDGPYNVVIWPAATAPIGTVPEVGRVTARAVDAFTITRAQEGSAARTIVAGDQIGLAVTDKTLDDYEALAQFTLLVAPSNASAALKARAAYVCTGANDDVTITAALDSLPFNGGQVKLLAGDYFMGTSATSFIEGYNTKGGKSLVGSGRRQAATIHVPAGSSAPCAVKMAANSGGSQTVRDLFVKFDNPTGTFTHGIWMQSSEAQVYDCVISDSSGHGIVLDGEPTARGGAPFAKGTSGTVRGCEVQYAGSGATVGSTVAAADGIVATNLHENADLEGNFINGGLNSCGATLTAALTSGVAFTTISCTPLTGTINAGDLLIIETVNTVPPTRQIVAASAGAAPGATSISVTSAVANFSYGNNQTTYVINYTQMKTRAGFRIDAFSHLHDCHPYFCYMAGLWANVSSVAVVGGEYETNGWVNINLQGSLIGHLVHSSIQGIHSYGAVACASIFCFGLRSCVIEGNYLDANIANQVLYMQSCNTCIVSSNAMINGVTNRGGNNFGLNMQSCDRCIVANNIVDDDLTPGAGRFGMNIFSCTNMKVTDNIPKVSSGTPMSAGSTTGEFRGNIGFNPVGLVTVAVPASTVAIATAVYDRTFYITAGAGATTIALASGPTVTLTASALNTIRVPAGVAFTPTYANPPTWVVEGE